MKKNEGMDSWFRSRLGQAEMPVQDGFWEQLQQDLNGTASFSGAKRRFTLPVSLLYRITAAASVLLLLGVASVAFWLFSPKEEIRDAFTQISELTPEVMPDAGSPQTGLSSTCQESLQHLVRPSGKNPVAVASAAEENDEDEEVSFTISFTVTQQIFEHPIATPNQGLGYNASMPVQGSPEKESTNAGLYSDKVYDTAASTESAMDSPQKKVGRNWALKAGMGSSLSKNRHHSPITASVSVERSLSERLSIESGVTYNYLSASKQLLPSAGSAEFPAQKIHALSVPLKLNTILVGSEKCDLYATVGGAIEKLIGKDCGKEPLQLSAAAGLGVCYRLSNSVALFAESSVSRHWAAGDTRMSSLRTERPTNLNLLCGVRMTY